MTPPDRSWFSEARYGLFLHWGPYALYARGEQVLMRDMMDQDAYARAACAWNPSAFDARAWAEEAVRGGFRYVVFTTRHHDGFCLWDTQTTDYSSARQAARRDVVREVVDAFRAAGLRVGLYYSWSDFRIPALFRGPAVDPEGWRAYRDYVHAQVKELCTNYGKIDVFWFDGVWPRNADDWGVAELLPEMRRLQPGLLINNRLGWNGTAGGLPAQNEEGVNAGTLGDFGTPEHHITAESGRLWESCQTSTWRLWSHVSGERWRSAEQWLDFLTDAASQGGNLLLNVGPTAEGRLPAEFIERSRQVGAWLRTHGVAVYGTDRTGPCGESVLFGRIARKANRLFLIIRFWPNNGSLRLAGLATPVRSARLLTTGQSLALRRDAYGLFVDGLPIHSPDPLFPVIELVLEGDVEHLPSYVPHLWAGAPERFLPWAEARGRGFEA